MQQSTRSLGGRADLTRELRVCHSEVDGTLGCAGVWALLLAESGSTCPGLSVVGEPSPSPSRYRWSAVGVMTPLPVILQRHVSIAVLLSPSTDPR